MHPNEMFDMFRMPSVNRVAPLAQSLRGRYQFYSGEKSCPFWLRAASTAYYVLLKLVSMVVYFGVPAFALIWTFEKIQDVSHVWHLMIRGGVLVAAATLLQVFGSDLL